MDIVHSTIYNCVLIISINKVLDVKPLIPLFIKKYANSLTNTHQYSLFMYMFSNILLHLFAVFFLIL